MMCWVLVRGAARAYVLCRCICIWWRRCEKSIALCFQNSFAPLYPGFIGLKVAGGWDWSWVASNMTYRSARHCNHNFICYTGGDPGCYAGYYHYCSAYGCHDGCSEAIYPARVDSVCCCSCNNLNTYGSACSLSSASQMCKAGDCSAEEQNLFQH